MHPARDRLAENGLVRRFLSFSGVGAAATGLQYLLLIALVEWLGVTPLPASVLSYLASTLANYWANYHFTFGSTLPHRQTLPRFALVAGGGLLLNSLVFYIANALLGMIYLLAQLIATVVVLAWNFTMNHLWSFSDRTK